MKLPLVIHPPLKIFILFWLAFEMGSIVQYCFDARLVRSELHGHHWNLAKNVLDEAEFRREAIGFLMNGKGVK